MRSKSACELYITDLVYLFREAGAEAQRNKSREPEAASYHEGRQMAYQEVLLLMQSQADTFLIPRESIGLDGFDSLNDSLDPPKPDNASN